MLAVEDEHGALLCGEEHVLAVAAAGLPRAHAVLAPDSFVWRCDDERACSVCGDAVRRRRATRTVRPTAAHRAALDDAFDGLGRVLLRGLRQDERCSKPV